MTYSKKELYRIGRQRTLRGRKLDEVSFPLGGIGAGMICLGGWGQLAEWQIWNRPAKNHRLEHCFFTLAISSGVSSRIVRVLQGPAGGSYVRDANGGPRSCGEGLPHFRNVSFTGEFPFAFVDLSDPDVPVRVRIEAFSPFIPLNDRDSSIPAAILLYRLKNSGRNTLEGTVYGNLRNTIGHPESRSQKNEFRRHGKLSGLYLSNPEIPNDHPRNGSMALSTTATDTDGWPWWHDEKIFRFWDAVSGNEDFGPSEPGVAIGTLGARFSVPAGAETVVPFFLTWHFPIFEHWKKQDNCCDGTPARPARWKNYYASQWKDAWDVASYVHAGFDRLFGETRLFHDHLFRSSLPAHVLDAVSSQISILKTPTCLRLEDGTFYGFEGCSENQGCCDGSCTHVWNYAQALPYLFPSLQRSMREADYANNMAEDGMLQFRMALPLGTRASWDFHPAADGQMGGVLQTFREWKLSGDNRWMEKMWPATKRALEFAWKYWDADRDGVMEGMQHNTYDVEFYGPNTVCGSLYLAALLAAEEMARHLGDEESAREYRRLFENGSQWTDAHLFNGDYYHQEVRPCAHLAWPERYRELSEKIGMDCRFPWPRWQYGKGCMSDQLIGQWYARMLGLDSIYDPVHVRKALKSIIRFNWKQDLTGHACTLRVYALNEESGLLVGTWPRGERPGHYMFYADEVWTGIEYEVACLLIYEGMTDEGLALVKAARDRYDGERRNPWDEVECGHYYARAMSSYSLLLALSGFSYSAPERRVGFAPRIRETDFRTFFCVGSGWGSYRQKLQQGSALFEIEIARGSLHLSRFVLPPGTRGGKPVAELAGQNIPCRVETKDRTCTVVFSPVACIQEGQRFRIRIAREKVPCRD